MGKPLGYQLLDDVLSRAYHQAAVGKGAERHANDKPFHEQPMQKIAERRGIGFILGQADKKSEEAQGMVERGERDAAVRELLGAIVYLAGAIIFLERQQATEPIAANDNDRTDDCANCSAPRVCSRHGRCLGDHPHG